MSLLSEYTKPVDPVETEEAPAAEGNALGDMLQLFESLSNEAFTVGDLNSWLQRKAATISAGLRDYFRTVTTWNFQRPDVLNVAPVVRVLNLHQYTDLMETEMYTPVGFQNGLEEYTRMLTTSSQPLALKAFTGVLSPMSKCLSYYINNIADANESRELIVKLGITTEEILKVIDAEAEYFIPGNHRTTATLGDLFPNKTAWVNSANAINAINHVLWQQIPPHKVKAQVDMLVKLAPTLLGQLETHEDTVSPAFVRSIMGQITDVARFIEWYSTFVVRMADLTSAMKQNEKILLAL